MTTRRQFIRRTARWGALLGAGGAVLAACGDDSKSGSPSEAKGIADGLKPEAGPLKIVNYADYVAPDVIAAFEKQYGVKVEIVTIDTDTEMTTKLASGAITADLHHSLANNSIGRLIAGGLLQPLNKSYLPNAKNIVPAFNDPWYDPGAKYSMPYTFFGTGIGYRADRIDPQQVEAWGYDTFWNAAKFKGQCSIIDDEREAFTMALLRNGVTDINTTDRAAIDKAVADVTGLVDLLNVKVNVEGYKDIPEGTTTIAQLWSADLILGANGYLPDGTDASVLGYWRPPAGSYVMGNDALGVLAKAKSPVLAHLYIDFLLDNDIAELNFAGIGYLPAIAKLDADYVVGKGLVPENLRNCVPTKDDIDKGLRFKPLDDDTTAYYEDAWATFRAGS